jgi:hypothetical protein
MVSETSIHDATQVEVMKVKVRHWKQEEGEKTR